MRDGGIHTNGNAVGLTVVQQIVQRHCEAGVAGEIAGQDLRTWPVKTERSPERGLPCPQIFRSQYAHREFPHVYNLTEAYGDPVSVPLEGRYHVYDYWNERYLGICEGNLTVADLPPRGCRLFWLTPVAEEAVTLAGGTGHIVGAGIWLDVLPDGYAIHAPALAGTEQSVTLAVPEGVQLHCEDPQVLCDRRKPGVLKLHFIAADQPVVLHRC